MLVRRTRGPLRRSLPWATAAALGAAVSLSVITPAAAAPVTGGSLDWGFKSSFRAYISTGNGNPPIAVSDGATRNADGTFRFTVDSGSYDAATGATTVRYAGTVVFSYPAHFFAITLANPTVRIDAAGGSLLADVDLDVSGGGFEPISLDQAEIATLGTSGVTPEITGGTVSWSHLTSTLTETGATAFNGFFAAGAELDPVSVRLATSGDGTPATPSIAVNPSSGVDPAGATLAVTGSGFDPAANGGVGFYLVFGPKSDEFWTTPRRYRPAVWVRTSPTSSTGQAKLNDDGTFSTTLDVAPTYTDGDGNPVDCRVTPCYVMTFAAHGSTDRSQDTHAPVTFAGAPGSGADQELRTQVRQDGPLTLTSAGTSVTMTAAAPGAVADGALHTVTVSDQRGSNAGWNVIGQVEDFTSTTGGVIAADNLGWTPSASVVDDGLVGSTGVVTPGTRATPGAGTGLGGARTLCAAAAGSSAGSFRCGADLDLGVPASTAPGDYTATLTLTLS